MKRIFLKLTTMVATVLLMSFIMISVVFALESNGYFTDDRGQRLPCDWSLDTTTGILRITGSGALPDYDSGECLPFAGGVNGTWIGPYVRIVYVEDGITRIGKYGFTAGSGDLSTPNIHTVYIEASVTQIGEKAFARQKIKKVVIYGEEVTFESNAISSNATIYGYAGSSVEQYAKENGNEFVPICREHTLETVEFVEPSCLTEGYSGDKVCTVCGLTIEKGEVINALGHNYETVNEVVPSCTEGGYSGDILCSSCGDVKEKGKELPAKGHAFGGWQVTTMPTCQSLGEKIRFCENCDVYEVADIAMLDHKWNDFYTVDREALCELEGSESIHCSICGTKQEGSDQVIKAKGHSLYVAESFCKNATCTEGGLTVYFCKNCDYALEETIAPLGHDWDADGKCTRCGESKYKDGWTTILGKKYYFVNGIVKTGWYKENGKWYYLDPTDGGAMATGKVRDGSTYYFMNEDGVMQTGWIKDGDIWYYAASSGALAIGWRAIGGKWYYFGDDHRMYDYGQHEINGKNYYFNKSGQMLTGWIKDGDIWYYAVSSGALATGWLKLGNTWYYLDPETCEMQTGFVKVGDATYYMASSGAMQTGWIKITSLFLDGQTLYTFWYYANSSGVLQIGWQKIGGAWYYFDPRLFFMHNDGRYQIDGNSYFFNESGAMRTGWCRAYHSWYYANSSGVLQGGWQKINGVWYYFDPDGKEMVSTDEVIDGKIELFDSSGAWKGTYKTPGWVNLYGAWFYVENDGKLATGWRTINGVWYYFDPYEQKMANAGKVIDGKLELFDSSGAWKQTYKTPGWVKINGEWYYVEDDGTLATGWRSINDVTYYFDLNDCHMYHYYDNGPLSEYYYEIDGDWYYFDKNGALQTGWQEIAGYLYYFDLNDFYMYRDGYYEIDGLEYYFDEDGHYVEGIL